MTDKITLSPCPLCEGPPVPFVRFIDIHGKVVRAPHIEESEDGLHAEAHVFCHECGAEGPIEQDIVFTAKHVDQITRKAVTAWNARTARHRKLYDAGAAEQLNVYPRPVSGAIPPMNVHAGQRWLDTSTTPPTMRVRNEANTWWQPRRPCDPPEHEECPA